MPKIEKSSWLNFSPLVSYGDFEFWDTADFPQVLPQDDDIFLEIDSNYVGRLDLVAFDFYQDANLWWIIALANKMYILPTDAKLNLRIRIPNKTYVDSLLSRAEG